MLETLTRRLFGGGNKRSEERIRIFRPATLVHGDSATSVHMLDASSGGAMVHSPSPLPCDELVWLRTAGLDIPAEVVWTRGNRSGLAFQRRLTADQLDLLVRAH